MKAAIDSSALLADEAVLRLLPTYEINGYQAIEQLTAKAGSQGFQHQAKVHWRAEYVLGQAKSLPVMASSPAEEVGQEQSYDQVVIAAQRDRQATFADAFRGWRVCSTGGRLIIHGGNDIGIRSTAKQLAQVLDVQPEVVSSRAHARVLCFVKPHSPSQPPEQAIEHIMTPSGESLATPPGVFAAGRVDRGSRVLLKVLSHPTIQSMKVESLADIGCGSGILGLEALHYWPQAQAYFADADARSCAATQRNIEAILQTKNALVHWWDSAEEIVWPAVDLVISNPPWHHRGQVDRRPGLRMCEAVGNSLKPGSKALIVATITQPFETTLQRFGRVENMLEEDGFKVLLLEAAS